jgi:hypothetical protein
MKKDVVYDEPLRSPAYWFFADEFTRWLCATPPA